MRISKTYSEAIVIAPVLLFGILATAVDVRIKFNGAALRLNSKVG